MQNTYLVGMKSERSAIIRARLETLQEKTLQAYYQAQDDERAAWFIGDELVGFSEAENQILQAEERVKQLWKQIETLSFRLSLVLEPACKFCGSTWGLSQEVDLRYGVDYKEAARAGCFWCCGSCYAHVLNAAYSNLPEMRPEWTAEEVSSHDKWLSSQK